MLSRSAFRPLEIAVLRRAARRLGAAALAALLALPVATGPAASDTPAAFRVTDEVINPDLQPFTATFKEPANGARLSNGGAFEPEIYRTMFTVPEDAQPEPDRIPAQPGIMTQGYLWRSGAFDGAEIEVLRIENGAFRRVRLDRVAPGGFVASGWEPQTGRRIVAADTPRYTYSWRRHSRPDAPVYFTVHTVDRNGAVSPPAAAVSQLRPDREKRKKTDAAGRTDTNRLVRAKLSGRVDESLPPPRNLEARPDEDGNVQLSWDPVPGAKGYAVYRSDVPPEEMKGYYLDLEGQGETVQPGDLVFLRTRILQPERQRLVSNRDWTGPRYMTNKWIQLWPDEVPGIHWELVPHDPDTVVEEPGETYLSVTLENGQALEVGRHNHAGTAQTVYPVLDPAHEYKVEVWMRGTPGTQAQFEFKGYYARNNALRPQHIGLTPEWKKHEITFRPPTLDTGRGVSRMQIQLSGTGRIDMDNLRIYRADAPFMALLPEDEARLKAAHMSALRTSLLAATKQDTYDLRQLIAPAGVSSGGRNGTTLPQMLQVAAQVETDPWLQIEPHLSREEWLGLAEFLAAPFDPAQDDPAALPWAAMRHAQGQAQPWTDRFDSIHLELGIETWNRLFAPWKFPAMVDAATGRSMKPGEVYGLYQEYVLGILRSSPYWPALEPRLRPLLGGWAGMVYGMDAARRSPHSNHVTHAAYIGGWDENEGPVHPSPASYTSVLTHVLQVTTPRVARHVRQVDKLSRGRAQPLQLGTYEAGPGYAVNGLNGAKVSKEQAALQEEVMKSAASGAATIDSFLTHATLGATLQNFFGYTAGPSFSSHADWYNGGQTYPAWDLLALFNRVGTGDMLAVEPLEVPTTDLPEVRRREAVRDAPLVAAYATRDDDRLTLVLVSRRIPGMPGTAGDGHTPVSLDLPIAGAQSLTIYRQSGDWTSHNVATRQVEIEAETLPAPAGLPRLEVPDLPPGEAMVLVLEGVTNR